MSATSDSELQVPEITESVSKEPQSPQVSMAGSTGDAAVAGEQQVDLTSQVSSEEANAGDEQQMQDDDDVDAGESVSLAIPPLPEDIGEMADGEEKQEEQQEEQKDEKAEEQQEEEEEEAKASPPARPQRSVRKKKEQPKEEQKLRRSKRVLAGAGAASSKVTTSATKKSMQAAIEKKRQAKRVAFSFENGALKVKYDGFVRPVQSMDFEIFKSRAIVSIVERRPIKPIAGMTYDDNDQTQWAVTLFDATQMHCKKNGAYYEISMPYDNDGSQLVLYVPQKRHGAQLQRIKRHTHGFL